MGRIGVGVIGAGGIVGRWHLPEVAAIEDYEIRLLAGRRPHRLDYLVRTFGGRATSSYQEVIDAPDVDAVLVATPHPMHVEWGIRVLAAGKHLLMQKPLCGDLAEADRFADAANRARSVVMCLPHFGAEVRAARHIVQQGRLGIVSGAYARTSHGGPELYYASVRAMFGETDEDLWFFDARRASVGALFDMGVYAVARLVAILGSVRNVYCRLATLEKPTELDDSASLVLEFERGCVGIAETSWCDPAWTWLFHLHGTEAKLVCEGFQSTSLTLHTPTSKLREDAPVNCEPVDLARFPTPNAHELWRDCIVEGKQPELSSWQAARHVTEILLAATESSRQRRPIDVRSRI